MVNDKIPKIKETIETGWAWFDVPPGVIGRGPATFPPLVGPGGA